MWDLIKEIDVLQTELKRNLDEIDYQMVEQLVDKLLQQHFLEAQAHFCSGFPAGLLLIQEARALGEKQKLDKPVAATGDVHFLEPQDSVYRSVLQSYMHGTETEEQAPLYFRTTEDMLAQFSYLPQEKAYELVVENPNRIAEKIEPGIRAIPKVLYPPSIAGAEESLREDTMRNARERYGDPLRDVLAKPTTRLLFPCRILLLQRSIERGCWRAS